MSYTHVQNIEIKQRMLDKVLKKVNDSVQLGTKTQHQNLFCTENYLTHTTMLFRNYLPTKIQCLQLSSP